MLSEFSFVASDNSDVIGVQDVYRDLVGLGVFCVGVKSNTCKHGIIYRFTVGITQMD